MDLLFILIGLARLILIFYFDFILFMFWKTNNRRSNTMHVNRGDYIVVNSGGDEFKRIGF